MKIALEYTVQARFVRTQRASRRLQAFAKGMQRTMPVRSRVQCVSCLWANAIRLGLLILCLGIPAACLAAEPARVLLLIGADPSQPAVFVQIHGIRRALDAGLPGDAEVYLDSIDGFRFGDEHLAQEFLALLQKKYQGQHIDLVIVMGTHAADFALAYRTMIWPGTPVLFSSVSDSWVRQHMPVRCVANVTELERFGLSASNLPKDCELINLPPSIFREYRGTMLAMLGVLLAQAVTIVALVTQRRRRCSAEAEAAARGNELARAARFATAGELSASIAHEVGQPLGAILSNADAAELLVTSQHMDVEELQDILSDVKRDALRANDVVQRLRALLQKQGIVFAPIPLDATLKGSLPLLEPEARRRAIRIEAQFGAGDLEVMGDHVQLQQVLLNLAMNAMDAMHETAPEHRVLTLVTRQDGEGVEIVVADRGGGFLAGSAEQLFEPFYTTKPHGMGLGLSIVRSIVEAHHGHVDAALRGGGGAQIVVWLPLVQGRHRAAATAATADRAAAASAGGLSQRDEAHARRAPNEAGERSSS